jgi:hypothetical protein
MRVLSNSSPWGPRGRVKCDLCTQTVLSSEDSSGVLSVYLATGDQGRIGSYLASAEPGDRSDAVRTADTDRTRPGERAFAVAKGYATTDRQEHQY